MVCAPSNAAVDNVIIKVMEEGFRDGNGMRYNPVICRVGSGGSRNDLVRDVTLQGYVDKFLEESSRDPTVNTARISSLKAESKRLLEVCKTHIQRLRTLHAHMSGKKGAPKSVGGNWELYCHSEHDDKTSSFRGKAVWNDKSTKTAQFHPPPHKDGPGTKKVENMEEYYMGMRELIPQISRFIQTQNKIKNYQLASDACRDKGGGGGGGGGGGRYAGQFNSFHPGMGVGIASSLGRQAVETNILETTEIVFVTLGSAGQRCLTDASKFEVVIIDEAAQSVEPSSLVALRMGRHHCVLVGDPQQLPATVFSTSGRGLKYDRSLFQRLEEGGERVYMLNEQYRMHPDISAFPREIFYKGLLQDGANVRKKTYGAEIKGAVGLHAPLLSPFTIVNLKSSESKSKQSLTNSSECALCVNLVRKLAEGIGVDLKGKIGVITPYSEQVGLIRRRLKTEMSKIKTVDQVTGQRRNQSLAEAYKVEINSVDGFQGREKEVIIFSSVRAGGARGIGFLADVRRMNVALTRAKQMLIVVADCERIMVNDIWRKLIDKGREEGVVVDVGEDAGFGF